MHAPLHESAPDFPLRKFRIVCGNGHEARFSPLDHLSIMVIRLPDEQFSLHLIKDAQPIRFLWHVQCVEKRLRFHRCSVEIVGGGHGRLENTGRIFPVTMKAAAVQDVTPST
jgi:hypothetical protein